MSARDALLRAVIDSPGDDTPRLAFADFLEEAGGPADAARAELIRVQVATRGLRTRDPRRKAARRRAEELTAEFRAAWLPPLPASRYFTPGFHRGFVKYWQFDSVTQLALDSPTVFDHEPVTDAYAYLNPDEVPRVAGSPRLARVRDLHLRPRVCSDDVLAEFFRAPHLTGLRALRVEDDAAGPAFLRVVANSAQYAGLESLAVEHQPIGDAGADIISAARTLGALKRLTLRFTGITSAGFNLLVFFPTLAGVTDLNLGGNALDTFSADLLADFLGHTPHFRNLARLELDETAVTDNVAANLAGADWPGLKSLTLSHGSAVPRDLPRITAAGVESLTAGAFAGSLESLRLDGNPLGDAGAALLARFPRLRFLFLDGTGIGPAGVRAILDAPFAPNLSVLSLSGCPVGDAGAAMIADAPWPNLWGLDLRGCDVGEAGARALQDSATLPPDLEWLHLTGNAIGGRLVAELREKYGRLEFRPPEPPW